MPTPRKFKLLKEAPDSKAGSTFTLNDSGDYYVIDFNDSGDYYVIDFDFRKKSDKHFSGELFGWAYHRTAVENNPEWFEEVFENTEPLKYPNGAVVEPPEKGETYWFINSLNDIESTLSHNYEISSFYAKSLANQNVFLTKEEAQKALNQSLVFNQLYKKIQEIDRENNWVCDWNDSQQEKLSLSFYWENKSKHCYSTVKNQIQGVVYMSEESAKYMMSDKVSVADFKLFCGIFN
jgi:hypothetical protein